MNLAQPNCSAAHLFQQQFISIGVSPNESERCLHATLSESIAANVKDRARYALGYFLAATTPCYARKAKTVSACSTMGLFQSSNRLRQSSARSFDAGFLVGNAQQHTLQECFLKLLTCKFHEHQFSSPPFPAATHLNQRSPTIQIRKDSYATSWEMPLRSYNSLLDSNLGRHSRRSGRQSDWKMRISDHNHSVPRGHHHLTHRPQ